jgi:hypothetical protein
MLIEILEEAIEPWLKSNGYRLAYAGIVERGGVAFAYHPRTDKYRSLNAGSSFSPVIFAARRLVNHSVE